MKRKNETELEACNDKQCPIHGTLSARGRIFEGVVVSKFPRRLAIQFDRTVFIKKYERYSNKRTKIHARLPDCMKNIEIGDLIQIQECRPLSKIIHFVVIKKMKSKDERKAVK